MYNISTGKKTNSVTISCKKYVESNEKSEFETVHIQATGIKRCVYYILRENATNDDANTVVQNILSSFDSNLNLNKNKNNIMLLNLLNILIISPSNLNNTEFLCEILISFR